MAKGDVNSVKSRRKVRENKGILQAQVSGQEEAHSVPKMNSFKGQDL